MADVTTNPVAEQENQNSETTNERVKIYTEEDIASLKSQWETDYKAKVEKDNEAAKKAEEFAKLPENEQIVKRAEDAEAEVADLRGQLAQKELNEFALSQLSLKNLPPEALSFVHGKDNKAITDEIIALENFITNQAQKRVEDKIKGSQHVPFKDIGTSLKNDVRSRGVQRLD